jgi:triphosphoribosyl-dephospho-CoA synthase
MDRRTWLGLCAQLACTWEATARKPGNVHPFADFADTSYRDFLAGGAALASVLAAGADASVGAIVLAGVEQTRRVTRANINLGILLLLAPLAVAARQPDLRTALPGVLQGLTLDDARQVYAAIRLARPGGLGQVAEQDVAEEPTVSLREAMLLAADRDLIARQYANGFHEVLNEGVPAVEVGMQQLGSLEEAIVHAQLSLLANHPDSLIARKCGLELAQEASRRARAVLEGCLTRAEFDTWLRADGNRRNPGTTADLLAACLFVALWEGRIEFPPQVPWSREDPPCRID